MTAKFTFSLAVLLSHDIHETLHDFIHGLFLTLEAFLSILCTGIPFHGVVSTLFITVSWGQVYSPYGAIYFLLFSLEAWLFNICILFYFFWKDFLISSFRSSADFLNYWSVLLTCKRPLSLPLPFLFLLFCILCWSLCLPTKRCRTSSQSHTPFPSVLAPSVSPLKPISAWPCIYCNSLGFSESWAGP